MDAIRINVDVGVFSPDVISRTAHRYSGEFFVEVSLSASPCHVALTPKRSEVDTTHLALRFGNDLLDERLRACIRDETSDLHVALVQAALREASPDLVEVGP